MPAGTIVPTSFVPPTEQVTSARIDALLKLNADFVQGFYFSQPLPAGEAVVAAKAIDTK